MSSTVSGSHPSASVGSLRVEERSGATPVLRVLRRLAPLAIYAALVVAVLLSAEQVMGALERTERSLGGWGPVIFAAGGGLFVAAAGPASLINLGAGALFGFWRGLAVAFAAALLGSTLAYGLARAGGEKLSERFAARYAWFRVLEDRIGTDWKLATFLRLSPVVPLAASSYALGFARMRLGPFLRTAPAMLPPLALYVGAAAFARDVWRSGSRPWWEWAILVVGGLATVGAMTAVSRAVRDAVRETDASAGPSEAVSE